MKHKNWLFGILSILIIFLFISCQKQVTIGEQVFMAENLDVDKFRNGDEIPEILSAEDWKIAGEIQRPAWCYLDFDEANRKKYGKFYNWYAVNDKRGLAPDGWHIPSNDEWEQLIDFLGEDVSGTKTKSTTGWELNTADNESGFTGLPAGRCSFNGDFDSFGRTGYWWSFTDTLCWWYQANFFRLEYDDARAGTRCSDKVDGFSVRCIKD